MIQSLEDTAKKSVVRTRLGSSGHRWLAEVGTVQVGCSQRARCRALVWVWIPGVKVQIWGGERAGRCSVVTMFCSQVDPRRALTPQGLKAKCRPTVG